MSKSFSLQVLKASATKPPLFFNIIKVTEENSLSWWHFNTRVCKATSLNFDEEEAIREKVWADHPDSPDLILRDTKTSQGYKHKHYSSGGAQMLNQCLPNFREKGVYVFMAFASDTEITELTDDNKSSIEMLVTVTTSENAPCSKHMGISRVMSYSYEKHHPGISLGLHGFAAKFIADNFPGKLFMMTSPIDIMSVMITNAMDKADMDSKYFYHSDGRIDNWAMTRAETKETRICTAARYIAQKNGLVPKDLTLNYDEGTNTAHVFHYGLLVATIDSKKLYSKEFNCWITREFQMGGCTVTGHTIAVELDALAKLGGFDKMDFHVDSATDLSSGGAHEHTLGGCGAGGASSVDLA